MNAEVINRNKLNLIKSKKCRSQKANLINENFTGIKRKGENLHHYFVETQQSWKC